MLPYQPDDLQDDRTITISGHLGEVRSVAFSPSNHLLASGSSDKTIQLWNAESGANITTLNGRAEIIWSIAFSPDGKILASGCNKSIKLWEVKSDWKVESEKKQIATLKNHTDYVRSIAFSPDSTRIVSGSSDKTVQIWDVKSDPRTNINVLKGHTHWVNSVAFSPDGARIASGSSDTTIRLWEASSGACVAILKGHPRTVTSVAFSPDGKHLASGSYDTTIRLWDPAKKTQLATMEGHSETVWSVAFSPNSEYLASGSNDTTLRLWEVSSRSQVKVLDGHSQVVLSVAFSPDGHRLASASLDMTVRIWDADPGHTNASANALYASQPGMTAKQPDVTESPFGSIKLKNDITGLVTLSPSERIGLGGFGEVYLGDHVSRGKVALKKPLKVFDDASVRRFLREVDLWCSISHKNILPFLGMCRIGVDVYVVSPYIENGDLTTWIAKGNVSNKNKLLNEVAGALAHLHHMGVVHGDVKAQNILVAKDGSALLCDFGLAKAFDTMVTSTGTKGTGSVRWMAPELFQGGSRSKASDTYSFGITIAEVLSGRVPYHNLTETLAVLHHVLYDDVRPPKEPKFDADGKSFAAFWDAAEMCWNKEVKSRPSMTQVLQMIAPAPSIFSLEWLGFR